MDSRTHPYGVNPISVATSPRGRRFFQINLTSHSPFVQEVARVMKPGAIIEVSRAVKPHSVIEHFGTVN